MRSRVVIAAGGTGGHIFPAQALAAQLVHKDPSIEPFFMALGLETNPYFRKGVFAHRDIPSATPFRGGWLARCGSAFTLLRGLWVAVRCLREIRPTLVVGFGSFHTFPVLLAARLCGIPILLFEGNCVPGKVNRFFSRFAILSAVQFQEASDHLSGRSVEVDFPHRERELVDPAVARVSFGLSPSLFTLLVYGGSQGAEAVNGIAEELDPAAVQVLHFVGKNGSVSQVEAAYRGRGVRACVKEFEERMHWAWSAADLAICRAGAATLAEMLHFAVPALLVPYPNASDNHQLHNARLMSDRYKGGCVVRAEPLRERLAALLSRRSDLDAMRSALQEARRLRSTLQLSDLVYRAIQERTNVHFIGIGGIGMSALAHILLDRGVRVSGSDRSKGSAISEALHRKGAAIVCGHAARHVKGATCVVYSSAVDVQNPERLAMQRRGGEALHRSELLADLMEGTLPLVVSGAHGKTTTSALLAHALQEVGLDPSFALGGVLIGQGAHGRQGQGPHFVAEADESDGSFLRYRAFGGILTNIDLEHMDFWHSEERLLQGFVRFASQIRSKEHLFFCADDQRLARLALGGVGFGFSPSSALRIVAHHAQGMDIAFEGRLYEQVESPLMGTHNARNVASAFGMLLRLQVKEEQIRAAIANFPGVKRRAERKGAREQILFYDDYAHHPTEIRTTLDGFAKRFADRRLVVVFQPHRYSRTQFCFSQFAEALERSDVLVLTEIYGAGELPIEGITGQSLHAQIALRCGAKTHYAPRSMLPSYVSSLLAPNDLVLTLGAGDITHLSEEILSCWKKDSA